MRKILIAAVFISSVLGALFLYSMQEKNKSFQEAEKPLQAEKVAPPVAETPLPLAYESHPLELSDGRSFALSLPEGFDISLASSGMKRVRFMAKSPDGRLFVTDMKDLTDNSEGKIYILSDFNTDTKKFGSRTIYLSGLRNPNSLAFYTDKSGANWLYLALTNKLVRYKYSLNENSPTSAPETLATFPDYGLSYKYGGWHLTRTVAVHNDKVYVSVGSSCNSCEEKASEETRASIVEMDLDGKNQIVIAKGLRNAVGIRFKADDLYVSAMGADHLGNDKPEEAFYKIQKGTNYGWPYCYEYQSIVYRDDSKPWQNVFDCSGAPQAFATFPAHSAPLGLEFFSDKAPPELKDSFLLALHGSSDISLKRGYSIVRIDLQGKVEDFVTGFLQDGIRYGRPADILKDTDSSFFFTDDYGGNVYYVYK